MTFHENVERVREENNSDLFQRKLLTSSCELLNYFHYSITMFCDQGLGSSIVPPMTGVCMDWFAQQD